jgi:hypothetical protein
MRARDALEDQQLRFVYHNSLKHWFKHTTNCNTKYPNLSCYYRDVVSPVTALTVIAFALKLIVAIVLIRHGIVYFEAKVF